MSTPADTVNYKLATGSTTTVSLIESAKFGGETLTGPLLDSTPEPPQYHNEFYDVPRDPSSVFTGREEILGSLRKTCLPSRETSHQKSKRFVIWGLGGSGKTQICLKFAEENREKSEPSLYECCLPGFTHTDESADFGGSSGSMPVLKQISSAALPTLPKYAAYNQIQDM